MNIDLTKEEIEDIIKNLVHCESEGYLNYGDPAYSVMKKLAKYYIELTEDENDICIF